MRNICYVFPGQGGQSVGMGKDLYDNDTRAREIFDIVDDALGEKLSTLMFEGPLEELSRSENIQPAIFAVSMASLVSDKARNTIPIGTGPSFVAGHSLGEYAALSCVGTIRHRDMARLLRKRGSLMQKAAESSGGRGAMAAIIGSVDVQAISAEAAAETKAVCEVANDNGANQWVISGAAAAVEKAMEIAKSRGAKLVRQLALSVPTHSSLMAGATDEFRAALAEVKWEMKPEEPGRAAFVSNKTAEIMTDMAEIKEALVYQLTHGVRWRESILNLAKLGADEFIEIGPGGVLTGLIQRIAPEAKSYKLEV